LGFHFDGFIEQRDGFFKLPQLAVGDALFKVGATSPGVQLDDLLKIFNGSRLIAVGGAKGASVKPVVGILDGRTCFFGCCGFACGGFFCSSLRKLQPLEQ